MVGTKLFSFLTLPLIKQVIIYLHHSVVTLDWSNRFSQKTRHYGLGKTVVSWSFADEGTMKGMGHTYIFPTFEKNLNFYIISFGMIG